MKGSVEPSVYAANILSLLDMSVPCTLILASEPTTVIPLVRLVCVLRSLAVPALLTIISRADTMSGCTSSYQVLSKRHLMI